jgi:hypothetical protein
VHPGTHQVDKTARGLSVLKRDGPAKGNVRSLHPRCGRIQRSKARPLEDQKNEGVRLGTRTKQKNAGGRQWRTDEHLYQDDRHHDQEEGVQHALRLPGSSPFFSLGEANPAFSSQPLLDQLLGKDTVIEEKKVVTVTTRPDGTKQTSTAVERVKVEKKDKKEHKERKSPVRSRSPVKQHHYRSHSPPKHHHRSPSPPKHASSSSSVTRSVPRCSACNKKSKNGANFCEVRKRVVSSVSYSLQHCGGRVALSSAPSKHSCVKCHAKLKHDAKFCEVRPKCQMCVCVVV